MPFIFSFNKNARFTNYKLEQLLRTSTKNNLTEIIFQDDLGTNHEKKTQTLTGSSENPSN